MALNDRKISIKPGSHPRDPKHETVYQPSRGGSFRDTKPVAGTPKKDRT
ncbi:hypothetical protein [Streptomyces sp. NPDC054863]